MRRDLKSGAARGSDGAMVSPVELERVVRAAGALAMMHWPGAGHDVESWEKSPDNRVSEADLAVDRYLFNALGELAPDAGWLSEETADDPARAEKRRCWIVDPIDGTRDFLRGRDGWCVSIALVEDGEPVLAALEAPARRQTWLAQSGEGATLNGAAIGCSDCAQLAGARVPIHDLPKTDRDLAKVAQPNSIALRVAMVAAGEADLVLTMRWGAEWDLAAAALIASEAGATVTAATGERYRFNKPDPRIFGALATAPALYGPALERWGGRAHEIAAKSARSVGFVN